MKSLLIIERSPSQEPEETPVPEPGLRLDDLNPTQKTRLERFLQELVVYILLYAFEKYIANDYENDGDSGRNTPNRTVKRERDENEDSEAARKKRRSGPPVTIDLTDD